MFKTILEIWIGAPAHPTALISPVLTFAICDRGLGSSGQSLVAGVHGLPGPPAQPPVMEASRHMGAAALAQLLGTPHAWDLTARPETVTCGPAQVTRFPAHAQCSF